MCRKEQTYNISDKLTINTFDLQVQPFAVQKNAFSTGMFFCMCVMLPKLQFLNKSSPYNSIIIDGIETISGLK